MTELGERPIFACVTRDSYPSCVSALQGRSAVENSTIEARECGKAIEAFRRDQIAPVLARKSGYQVNLESAEAKSRMAATPEDNDRREYVLSEMERMRGIEWDRFVTVDRESYRDLGACNSAAKCTLVS